MQALTTISKSKSWSPTFKTKSSIDLMLENAERRKRIYSGSTKSVKVAHEDDPQPFQVEVFNKPKPAPRKPSLKNFPKLLKHPDVDFSVLEGRKGKLGLDEICDLVCEYHVLTIEDLRSDSYETRVRDARSHFWFLGFEHTHCKRLELSVYLNRKHKDAAWHGHRSWIRKQNKLGD